MVGVAFPPGGVLKFQIVKPLAVFNFNLVVRGRMYLCENGDQMSNSLTSLMIIKRVNRLFYDLGSGNPIGLDLLPGGLLLPSQMSPIRIVNEVEAASVSGMGLPSRRL